MKNKIEIWYDRENGITYRNGGSVVSEDETFERAAEGAYQDVSIEWQGLIPAAEFARMQKLKSRLLEIIQN